MRDISKKLTVINTGKKVSEAGAASQPSGVVYVGAGGGGGGGNLNDYLLKSIWNKVWEIRTDSQGTEYIFGKLPVVTQYGITMYSGDNVEIPSIAEGLPFDNRTIWFNPTTKQIEVIGGTGGGSGEGVSNFWDLSGIPLWITNEKPKYSYSEIEGTPDLNVYALKSAIPSLSGYATEQWVLGKGYALSSDLSKYIPIAGVTDITGEKNFTGGLKVNGSPIYYDTEKKYWKLEGDLLITGGVTMYGNDSAFVPSTIMDAIAVDGTTISKDGGILKVIGGTGGGGISSVTSQMIVDALGYTPASASALSGYLPLSGGTLSNGTTNTPLTIKGLQDGSWISYTNQNNTHYGSMGFQSDNQPYAYHSSYGACKLWHSGNFTPSNYLPLSGGTIKSTAVPQLILQGESTDAYITFKTTLNTADSAHSGLVNLPNIGASASFGASERIVFPFSGGMYYRNGYNGTNQTIWHAGNDGSGSGLDADLLDGVHLNTNQKPYGKIPLISADGVMEVGKYIDFHNDNTTGSDFSTRLICSGEHANNVSLPSASGTLALTSSNVASATKLQTARTIWGQSFDGSGNVDGTLHITKINNEADTYDEGIRINSIGGYSSIWLNTANRQGYDAGMWGITANNGGNLRFRGGASTLSDLVNITQTGNVGIGTANPSQKLHVAGNILATGGVTMYSARKLKTIQDERGLSLEELRTIKPTRFTWKDGRDNRLYIGGIADDVMKVLPEVIYKTGEDDTLTMDYGNAAFAIAASLIKPVVNHEERIKLLEEENKRLKEEVEQLKWNIA